jgi:hypothetical protein
MSTKEVLSVNSEFHLQTMETPFDSQSTGLGCFDPSKIRLQNAYPHKNAFTALSLKGVEVS